MTRARISLAIAMAAAASCCLVRSAHADTPDAVNRFSMTASAGWMHTAVFEVPMNLVDVEGGFGFTHQRPHGLGFDVYGLAGFGLGRTTAGRGAFAFRPLGVSAVLHIDWLRLGIGSRAGSLSVRRSTKDDSQTYSLADNWVSVGVEPIDVAGRPLFVEARLHRLSWDTRGFTAFSLAIGGRFCGEGCVR